MEEFHPIVKTIVNILQENTVWFETFVHKEVRTSEEASKMRDGYTLSQGAKALILRVKGETGEYKFIMVVVPGDKKFDGKKIKSILRVRDIRFATEEEIAEITSGVKVGGIPPFGNLFGLPVYVDHVAMENEKIIFNAGDRRFSIGMFAKDYQRIVVPAVVNVIA